MTSGVWICDVDRENYFGSDLTGLHALVASTAIVEEGVTIGTGAKIWHHAQIRAGASIGVDAVIGKGCFVDAGVVVGDRSKIQNGAQLYSPAYLEDGVFVGPLVILTNDKYPRAIAPDGNLVGAAGWTQSGCTLKHGASVGAGSVVICTTIGAWALVAASSVVTKPVAAHSLVRGNPATHVGWVCYCGVPVNEQCSRCGWGPA